jgi:DNA-binding NtrC family response regulator
LEHDWPGNVRELENVIQRAVLMAKNNVITDHDLVFDESPERNSQDDYFSKMTGRLMQGTLKKVLSEFECDMISHALSEHKGNVLQAARMLDVGKTVLYDKIKRYEISAKVIKPS